MTGQQEGAGGEVGECRGGVHRNGMYENAQMKPITLYANFKNIEKNYKTKNIEFLLVTPSGNLCEVWHP